MKRAVSMFVGLFFLGTFVHGAGDATKEDLERLQGKWKFVERIIDGKKQTGKQLESTWTFDGNRVIYHVDADLLAIVTLNAKTNPKTFDFDHESKDPKRVQKGRKGIYEIDGDILKICVVAEGKTKERPTAFESKEGSGYALTILKRVKDDK